MDLSPLDPTDASTASALYAVECAATAAARPGWVPLTEAARLAGWRADDGWRRELVGAHVDGELVGFAFAMTAADTPDTTWITAVVHPDHQRAGHGSALVRAAERLAAGTAARLVASTYRPTSVDLDLLAERFAGPLGYAVATTETVVELDLAGAVLPAAPPEAPYRVSSYVDGVPERLRVQVGVLKGLVDADAPSGDLAWEPSPVSPQEYAAELAVWAEQGCTVVESVAADTTTGDVIAWTCLVATQDPARPAAIEGTLVLAAHRGHALGRAVKAANLAAAREHTAAARVRTSSDDANTWMRRINADLGFVPVESEAIFQKRVTPI